MTGIKQGRKNTKETVTQKTEKEWIGGRKTNTDGTRWKCKITKQNVQCKRKG